MSKNVEVVLGRIMFDQDGDEAFMFKVNVPVEMMKTVKGPEDREALAQALMASMDTAMDQYMEYVNKLRADINLEPEMMDYPWRPKK